MTQAPNTQIKLNELNKILDEMETGEAAVKKLAEMDSQMGMQDPMQVAKRMRGDMLTEETVPPIAPLAASGDALGDNAIANNLRQQAMRMSTEAKGLLAEAERLMQEANTMDPVASNTSVAPVATVVKKTRGRPKRVSATV
jgi:exonuclease VII small subunit